MAAWACAIVTPGLSLANTRSARVLCRLASFKACGTSRSALTSVGISKSGGSTPMIVTGCASIEIILPAMPGSRAKRPCHNAYELSATLAPFGRSSCSVKFLPRNGDSPSVGRKFASTLSVRSQSATPAVNDVMDSNAVWCRRQSRYVPAKRNSVVSSGAIMPTDTRRSSPA